MTKVISLYSEEKKEPDKSKPAKIEHLCRRCGTILSRIPRSSLVKTLLFWLPVRQYVCYHCKRKTLRLS